MGFTYTPVLNSAAIVDGSLVNADIAAAAAIARSKLANRTVNPQTDSYTLVLADADAIVQMDKASANTLTIPPNASVAFPTGTEILVRQLGAGTTTITGDTGVTVDGTSAGSVAIGDQYTTAVLTKVDSNVWDIGFLPDSGTYVPLDAAQVGNLLTSGEETMSRLQANTSTIPTSTSQRLILTYFTARKTEAINNIRAISGNTAAGATPSLARMGLYAIDGAGAGSLVAACTSDTALFAATNTVYTRALTTGAGYVKTQGQRYAFGVLVVSAAAMPTLYGNNVLAGNINSEAVLAPRLCGFLAAQADLPASFADASLSAMAQMAYGVVTP